MLEMMFHVDCDGDSENHARFVDTDTSRKVVDCVDTVSAEFDFVELGEVSEIIASHLLEKPTCNRSEVGDGQSHFLFKLHCDHEIVLQALGR